MNSYPPQQPKERTPSKAILTRSLRTYPHSSLNCRCFNVTKLHTTGDFHSRSISPTLKPNMYVTHRRSYSQPRWIWVLWIIFHTGTHLAGVQPFVPLKKQVAANISHSVSTRPNLYKCGRVDNPEPSMRT